MFLLALLTCLLSVWLLGCGASGLLLYLWLVELIGFWVCVDAFRLLLGYRWVFGFGFGCGLVTLLPVLAPRVYIRARVYACMPATICLLCSLYSLQ